MSDLRSSQRIEKYSRLFRGCRHSKSIVWFIQNILMKFILLERSFEDL